ncbi:Protein of unknown function [Sulfurivirga caldicuralii]|uniref:Tll0287-like domain-containing protein n=1 Tax=Sulfurivirga caldicuralii TaxID=364032 RepID=A0A1N6G9Q4_9GAMM|nr:DUF3365 domain-containing protein [Sulfurivirga caldicuralii]SIO04152.1 Protein of unknown function [Sulfurivirga caldicuralii]
MFKGKTRRFATWVLLVFLSVWVGVSYYVYQMTWHTMLERAENEVRKMTVMELAIRGYVDEELKPLFYQLQQAGHISADYYAPQGFSATYVIRHVFQRYDAAIQAREALLKNGVRFRIVSDNPLNPANRASADELQWLQYFRANPSTTEHFELLEKRGSQQP